MVKKIIFITVLISSAMGQTCQYDGSNLIFTGKTKIESGHLTRHYKCPTGHEYWIVENNTTTNANTAKFAPAKPVLTDGASSFQAGFESAAAIAQRNKAIKLEEERLLIALAKMTPEERAAYYKLKEQKELSAKMESEKKLKIILYGILGFGIYVIIFTMLGIPL